jgi:hypothetical protein
VLASAFCGCAEKEKPYGREPAVFLPGTRAQTWAVAPAINLSGQRQVDPLLQADLLFAQLQQVKGLTVVPVNRVAEAYASLRIDRIQSQEQAELVCGLLGCDALVIPTVTLYDPFDPPKVGAALQWFARGGGRKLPNVDPRELARRATPSDEMESLPIDGSFVQVVGVYDAANGSVRHSLLEYSQGRNNPRTSLGPKEYLVSMDRYSGFVYRDLIVKLLDRPQLNGGEVQQASGM